MQVLLLEGIHAAAVEHFITHGCSVQHLEYTADPKELVRMLKGVHVLGVRSKSRITADVIESAKDLLCIGCFCIGTDKVDLEAARSAGIPVFNAPHSNTRSVAELVLGEIVMLMRGIPQKNWHAHEGTWMKSAVGAHEIRGKTLGIVGYGRIGSQLSVLAEALGMRVRYYDIEKKLSLGGAVPCNSLGQLLRLSDVVSLHVPATESTHGMIGRYELEQLRNTYLINASRGDVVDLDILAAELEAGRIAGAAIDVYPKEPATIEECLETPLRGYRNVILTPHIGGSTEEAQKNISLEVAEKVTAYSEHGVTTSAVNFAEVSLSSRDRRLRFIHIHHDMPGVLAQINEVFSRQDCNIAVQHLSTAGGVGYATIDVEEPLDTLETRERLAAIDATIRVRVLDRRGLSAEAMAARIPPLPDLLVGALHDSVHQDGPKRRLRSRPKADGEASG